MGERKLFCAEIMVKLLLVISMMGSSLAVAQSHSPTTYGGKFNPDEAVTFTGIKVVPISITNTDRFPQKFDITINGESVLETADLGLGVTEVINVPVKLSEIGVVEQFKICSISKPSLSQSSYRIKLCTVAKLLWAKR